MSVAMRMLVLGGLVGMFVAASPMPAQGRVVGVVYDSVAAQPLGSALVQLALVSDPTVSRSVRADARGRFRVDSIAAGTWVIAIMHPRIDSLGIQQLARPVTTRGFGEQRFNAAVPSAASLVREVCGDGAVQEGAGYLHGRLRPIAGSDIPNAKGAGQVEVQWVDMTVSVTKGVAVSRVPRRALVEVDSDGTFTVCGVPGGGTVRARGMLGADTTGMLEFLIPEHGIANLELAVGAVRHVVMDSQPVRRGEGVLRGRILGPAGRPLPNAAAVVWGTGLTARADSAGYWQLRQLPHGTHVVETRAVGYRPERHVVHIGDPGVEALPVATLDRMITLDTVRTRALRDLAFDPSMRAFEERRRVGLGIYRGPVELNDLLPQDASHLFRTLPGVRIEPVMRSSVFIGYAIGLRSVGGGRSCKPDLIIDRLRIASDMHDGIIDHLVMFTTVRAVEVYHAISGTPPEFLRAGNQCGTIVIWTGR